MRKHIATAFLTTSLSFIAAALPATSASAQITDKNLTMKFNPVVARMNCERTGRQYREVCVRFASPQNCDPDQAFGCVGECIETGMRCVERLPR
jgi:hypothetical protein